MLLIDGARYELWTPPTEDEFEQIIKEHAQEIFGENSTYIDIKQKVKSKSGIAAIPDGYVITFGDSPQWHIIEVELSSHPLYEHIVPQLSKFINSIKNPSTINDVIRALYDVLTEDEVAEAKTKKQIGSGEIYKFLSELIFKPPTITVIINEKTPELEETLSAINHPQKKVVEFQTFRRVSAESVHAHLFEPLYEVFTKELVNAENKTVVRTATKLYEHRITINNLLEKGLVSSFQKIFVEYKNNKYEAEIQPNGKLKLLHNGKEYDSPSLAATAITSTSVNGWVFWQVIDKKGSVSVIDDLRKQIR
jgi:hypothetical protein